jgi:hypothetical protein
MTSYLNIIYNELQSTAQRIKTDLKAEDVDNFAKIINRSIPDKNSEDGIRYDEFRLLFNANDRNKKTILTALKESKGKRNDISNRILWTSAYYIVKEFELEDLIFLDWQPKISMFAVGLRKIIEGLEDPVKSGHSFVYYFVPHMNEESAAEYEDANNQRQFNDGSVNNSYQKNGSVNNSYQKNGSANNSYQKNGSTNNSYQKNRSSANNSYQKNGSSTNNQKQFNNQYQKNNVFQNSEGENTEGWIKNTRNQQRKNKKN